VGAVSTSRSHWASHPSRRDSTSTWGVDPLTGHRAGRTRQRAPKPSYDVPSAACPVFSRETTIPVHLAAVRSRESAVSATHAQRAVSLRPGRCFSSNFVHLGPSIADPPELRFVCSPSKSCYGGRRERRGSDVGPQRREKVYADLCDQERPRLTPAVRVSPPAPTPSRPQERSRRLARGSTEPDPNGACRARGLQEPSR
jgi:hypothetical protein